MLLFSKTHTSNKKTSAASQGKMTLISETGSHVFEPPASLVVKGQKEVRQKSSKERGGRGETEGQCLQ